MTADSEATQGRLVVISGPSGAGKTSVCRALKRLPRVRFSVSATTRAMRDGEVDGRDYHFLSREEFERCRDNGEFLEYACYNNNLYGTLRSSVEEAVARGEIVVLEIEVQGTEQLRARNVTATYVFVVPPDMVELRRRLESRGTDSPEEIARRIGIAEGEMRAQHLYDHVIPNDVLDDTIRSVGLTIGLSEHELEQIGVGT